MRIQVSFQVNVEIPHTPQRSPRGQLLNLSCDGGYGIDFSVSTEGLHLLSSRGTPSGSVTGTDKNRGQFVCGFQR